MPWSSGVGDGRGIVFGRGGCGGLGGVGLEDPLPCRQGFHFHREMTLQLGDHTCSQFGNIMIKINLLYIDLFSLHKENLYFSQI
jgi:hypothetical protein